MKRAEFHNIRPDYSVKKFRLGRAARHRMLDKVSFLYGKSKASGVQREIERLMQVYYAHKTSCMIDWEKEFSAEDRFTERDAVLITYGDLIRDPDRKPLECLAELSRRYLRGVFNTLHILPFFPYSSDRGFAVVNFFNVDPNLGTWDDVAFLKKDFKLMFDGVFNHISAKSRWFQEFLNQASGFKYYFKSYPAEHKIPAKHIKMLFRPRTSDVFTEFLTLAGKRNVWTTFGPDQIDLNFGNPAVLLSIIEILLYYVRRGADLVRLDAVTYLWKELGTTSVHQRQTHVIIKLFRCILDEIAPHVALVTETNVPHRENISYFGDGTDEAQMVYNFALPPLILFTFLKGDCAKLSRWMAGLRKISNSATYFNFLDSHDGIGILGAKGILDADDEKYLVEHVKKQGGLISCKRNSDGSKVPYELNITSYSALNGGRAGSSDLAIRRYLAARSIPVAMMGVPGIYLHGLFGSRNDAKKARITENNRDINRKNYSRNELFTMLEDAESVPSRVSKGIAAMLRARQKEKAFHPNAAQKIIDVGPCVFCMLRTAVEGRSRILVMVNVTAREQTVGVPVKCLGALKDVLSGRIYKCDNGSLVIHPFEVAWFKLSMDAE